MPVMSCTKDNKPGFKYGKGGVCYLYVPGNRASREAARQKALRQGRAIKHSQAQHSSAAHLHCLRAELQHMAQAEVENIIPAEALSSIKQKDSEPQFKVFSVGHEGEATPKLVGGGLLRLQYFKDAIRKIARKLTSGLPVFNRHAATNAHEGRTQIGEVVGSALREIGGKLHSLAVTYIYPQFREDALDIASIETSMRYSLDSVGAPYVTDVENISGIALSSMAIDKPGFPGSTLLGVFQLFAEQGDTSMTLDELKEGIREGSYSPEDLFEESKLLGAECVKAEVTKGRAYGDRKRTELEKSQAEHEEEAGKLRGQVATLQNKVLLSQAETVFASVAKEGELSDQCQKFVEVKLSEFQSEATDGDTLKSDMLTFVDNKKKEFAELAGVFGLKLEKSSNGDKKELDLGVPPVTTSSPSGAKAGNDVTSPDNNPLIPGGAAAKAAGVGS